MYCVTPEDYESLALPNRLQHNSLMSGASALVEEVEPRKAANALRRAAPEQLRLLDEVIPAAIHGRPVAVRKYVKSWRHLSRQLLEITGQQVDLVGKTKEGVHAVEAKWQPSQVALEVLDQGALHAPFSPWVVEFGPGPGAGLFLLSEIRRFLPASKPLTPRAVVKFPYPELSEREFKRFARLVWDELTADDPLEMIASAFGLTDTELGALFSVTRQGILQWMEKGIPNARLPRVHSVQRIADVLRRNLKSDRLPAVVREAAPAYGNKSILEAIGRGEERKVLRAVERAFDWATTA